MFSSIYFGKMSKEGAERLLEAHGREGSFLARDSESEAGAFCLCVRRTPLVHTYRISKCPLGWAVETPPGVTPQCFQTLDDLIDCYRVAPPDSMAPMLHPLKERLVHDKEAKGEPLSPSSEGPLSGVSESEAMLTERRRNKSRRYRESEYLEM